MRPEALIIVSTSRGFAPYPTRDSVPGPCQGAYVTKVPPGPVIVFATIEKKGWRGLGRRVTASPEVAERMIKAFEKVFFLWADDGGLFAL